MDTTGPTKIRIVRGKEGFRVVPGTAVVPPNSRIAFRNLTSADVEVIDLDPKIFRPAQLPLGPNADGYVDVLDAPTGLYEYNVVAGLMARDGSSTKFYALGNSSPGIIVDP